MTLSIGRTVFRRWRSGGMPRISPTLLGLTALVYAAQVAAAQVLLGAPGRPWAQTDLCASLMALLAVGILRSWELLGMGRISTVILMRDPTAHSAHEGDPALHVAAPPAGDAAAHGAPSPASDGHAHGVPDARGRAQASGPSAPGPASPPSA
jgi:hypothetical protein